MHMAKPKSSTLLSNLAQVWRWRKQGGDKERPKEGSGGRKEGHLIFLRPIAARTSLPVASMRIEGILSAFLVRECLYRAGLKGGH